jgi:chorismate mutase
MDDLIDRLEKRAEIRRSIATRKSVQEGKPDRIADILDEAAREIRSLRSKLKIEREDRFNESCGLNQYGE